MLWHNAFIDSENVVDQTIYGRLLRRRHSLFGAFLVSNKGQRGRLGIRAALSGHRSKSDRKFRAKIEL
jgi:hypothetical protein